MSASCATSAQKIFMSDSTIKFQDQKIVLEIRLELLVTEARPSSRFVDRTKFLGYMLSQGNGTARSAVLRDSNINTR